MKLYLTGCISWQEFDGTVYVFNEQSRKTYLFSDTARDFWMAVVEYRVFETCLAALCRTYGENLRQTIQEDLLTFLREIQGYGLIDLSEEKHHAGA